jgi:hypothetical protein
MPDRLPEVEYDEHEIVRNKPGHPRLKITCCMKTWMAGTRFALGPAGGRTRVPGMTNERSRPLV